MYLLFSLCIYLTPIYEGVNTIKYTDNELFRKAAIHPGAKAPWLSAASL
jgi:hypothetical protein